MMPPLSRKKQSLNYSQTVFALFLAATLVPLLLLSSAMIGLAAEMVDAILTENVAEGVGQTGRRLDSFTAGIGRSLVGIAARPELGDTLAAGKDLSDQGEQSVIAAVRNRFREDDPPVNAAIVSLAGETVYATSGVPAILSDRFLASIRENPAGISISARKPDNTRDRYAAFYAGTAVIGPARTCVGYVIAEIPRETLKTVLAPLPPITDLYILDAQGLVAFALSAAETEGEPFGGFAGLAGNPVAGAKAGRDESRIHRYRGEKLSIVAGNPEGLVANLVERLTWATLLGSLLCALLALAASAVLSRRLSGPVTRLIEATKAVAEGNLGVTVVPEPAGDMAELMRNFNQMTGDLQRLFDKTLEKQELLKRAELDALGSQINPHFFFNALSSIDALAKLGACGEISTVTRSLGKLLRGSIAGTSRIVTLDESLNDTRHYLVIEKIRFADKFSWTERIAEGTGDALVPRLALQTLAENALTHGIEPSPTPAALAVESRLEGDALFVTVEDSGVGMETGKLAALNASLARGDKSETNAHIGLSNLNLRIRLEFGADYGVRLREREGGGIIAEMSVPYRRKDECTQ